MDHEPCPLGDPHCEQVPEGCTISVHAEANAIAFAARHGVALQGATVYTTHSPCVPCAQLIINAGIKEVNYLHDYRITDGRVLLSAVGIDTHQYWVI
jgi:dCMP deaminase